MSEYGQKLVGIAEIFNIDKTADMVTIGYSLNPEYWGKGIATITTRILVNYLFNEIQVNRIQAFVMTDNKKISRCIEQKFVYL